MARILVVDDEPLLRRTLRAILERAGHEVLEAVDGAKALNVFVESHPDLVLIDMVMPNREGAETIVDLRAAGCVPIIAMSGAGGDSGALYLRIAAEVGADRTLAKPIRAAALLEAVAACLVPVAG